MQGSSEVGSVLLLVLLLVLLVLVLVLLLAARRGRDVPEQEGVAASN